MVGAVDEGRSYRCGSPIPKVMIEFRDLFERYEHMAIDNSMLDGIFHAPRLR